MIRSKQDYFEYLEADRIALGIISSKRTLVQKLFSPHQTWRFQKRLRKLEYYKNCKNGIFSKLYFKYLKFRFKKLSVKLGFSIYPNVFGPGLALLHYGTIVVNKKAKIGRNCRMQACTNIGASGGSELAPHIGDNVYIGPGVKIFGDIKIASNIAISANSVVNKSFSEENIMIAGVPAKRIKSFNISTLIPYS